MYSKVGRASVPPERLLKASLLISLYSVRSERAFCEELEYNLLTVPATKPVPPNPSTPNTMCMSAPPIFGRLC